MDKLRLQTRGKEAEQALARGGKDPFIVVKNPSASKGGVAETSIKVGVYGIEAGSISNVKSLTPEKGIKSLIPCQSHEVSNME